MPRGAKRQEKALNQWGLSSTSYKPAQSKCNLLSLAPAHYSTTCLAVLHCEASLVRKAYAPIYGPTYMRKSAACFAYAIPLFLNVFAWLYMTSCIKTAQLSA